ncbi:glycosyl transferase family 2 [Vulcanibacillus modesticaldus]|uniref:Glycosyl transferase family 2 n=1 Tax=Vulcanibacillus modesticaldus TaxID=337097 RepID=A0A1D2YVW5_9BACI|nr:glycosyltransferase family 2 protein [Vulcanibacillus modesticaldus]OEF99786.1 glycosyl transferase family 2 [Vulcanibacillus modesticaldus]
MTKKVSIIMGIYNCEKTLTESIDSIINQSYDNWELIMCDDGSTDRTYEIALKYAEKDNRIKLIKNKKNIGLAKTLNNCLEISTGDYIMRHDGDDIMVKDRIEKQVGYMNTHNCDACGSGAYLFDETGIWGLLQPSAIPDRKCMVTGAPFIHPTVIMKKDKLNQVRGYSVNELTRQRLEDYDLWIKFFERNYILHNIQEPLIYYREDRNSYNRRKKKFRIAETRARLYACKRLNIPYLQRILALKPLIAMIVPNMIMRYYHRKKARKKGIAN